MKNYYVALNGQQIGPLDLNQVKALGIKKDTLIWFEGLSQWVQAGSVPELNPLFSVVPNYTSNPVSPSSSGVKPHVPYLHDTPKMFTNVFSFEGRIRRKELGLSFVFFYVGCILLLVLFDTLGLTDEKSGRTFVLIYLIGNIALLAQLVKRCHDLGESGWFVLIPFYNPFVLLFMEGKPGTNKYGKDPKEEERRNNPYQ